MFSAAFLGGLTRFSCYDILKSKEKTPLRITLFSTADITTTLRNTSATSIALMLAETFATGVAGDVATVMFPTAAPYISASSNAVDTLVDNLIDEDNSHKVAGEIISETIVSAAIGFFDGVSVRPQEITSDMGWKKVVSEARKDYLSGIVPDWFKEVFQDFLLDRCI